MSIAEYILYAAANAFFGVLVGLAAAHKLHAWGVWTCLP